MQSHGVNGLCITKLDVLDGMDEAEDLHGLSTEWWGCGLIPTGAEAVADCVPELRNHAGMEGVDGRE